MRPRRATRFPCLPSHLVLNGQQFSDFNFTPLDGFGLGTYTLIDAGSISGSLGANTSGMIDGDPATLAVQGNNLVLKVASLCPSLRPSCCLAQGQLACSAGGGDGDTTPLPIFPRFPQYGSDLAPCRGFMVLSAYDVSALPSIPASRLPSGSLPVLGSRIGLRGEVSLVPW